VFVGKETQAASARAISYEAVDPILAKGKGHPLAAWQARAASLTPADRPLSAAPFVGRDGEMELLVRTWGRISSELQPQLVTLVGPAGIGKSRLALELAEYVRSAGGRTLRGRPLPYGEPAAYWAFGQVIRDASGILATDSADAAAERLRDRVASLFSATESQELAAHLSILARLAEDTAQDRQALFGSAQRFLEALALEQPTLVVLEDLHCADDSLLELVEAFSARLSNVPLFLLALARPEFLETRPGWARLPTNVTVQLQALTDARAQDLVRRLLPGGPAREAVVKRVEAAAAGNPLFIEELAAWLSEGEQAHAAGPPTHIKTIIAARLDQLSPGERQVTSSGRAHWKRWGATQRSWRRCARSSEGASSAAVPTRGSEATRSWSSSTAWSARLPMQPSPSPPAASGMRWLPASSSRPPATRRPMRQSSPITGARPATRPAQRIG
jgi:hypothetical protein